jgi:hypothetical protein
LTCAGIRYKYPEIKIDQNGFAVPANSYSDPPRNPNAGTRACR